MSHANIASTVFLSLLLCGCSTIISPSSLTRANGHQAEAARAMKDWSEAVVICNKFLASDFRKTLPAGAITLHSNGMIFVTGSRQQPIQIRCSFAGDILIPFGAIAQERANGFVVGLVPPAQSRLLDNTLFKMANGKNLLPYQMAELILHELTHAFFRTGTVSFGKTVEYYLELIFEMRYQTHSMEIVPFQTSAEFASFVHAHTKQ